MTDNRVLKNFINGEYTETQDGETYDLVNPATGEVFAQAPASREGDVDQAFKAADKAFESWRDSTPADRQMALLKLADAIEDRAEEIMRAESENTGKTARTPHGRRDPDGHRPDPLFRRSRPLPGGQVRRRIPARPDLFHPPRAHRRLRPGNALELPHDDGYLEVRPGDSRRKHRRHKTLRHHPGNHPHAGRDGLGVPARRRLQRRLRGPGHRPRPHRASHTADGLHHGLRQGRYGSSQERGHGPQAHASGARRQSAGHRLRRRGFRSCGRGDRHGRLLQRRPGTAPPPPACWPGRASTRISSLR